MARDKYLQIRLDKEEQEIIRKAFNKEASTIARNYLLERALETLTLEELEELEEFAELKASMVSNSLDLKEFYKVKLMLKK